MKVENIGPHITDSVKRNTSEKSEAAAPEKVFRSTLTNLVDEEEQSFVRNKIEDIIAQGEKLSEKADLAQLNKYKEMIRELVNHTVSNGFKFSKSNRFDSRGRGKVYATIKKVNTTLDEMTQQVLESESENIDLIAQINDIRGLLVDMFM